MKGAKPQLNNVVPMKGDMPRPVPDPHDLMSDQARQVWERLAPQMVRLNRLEPHHEDMFAAYCEAVADVIELTSNLAMNGRTYEVKTRNGLQQKKTADWQTRQDALATMTRIGALFGMSPVDDNRLAGGGQGDLFETLLRKINGAD